MNKKNSKNDFVVQAGILAIAGIISRIIGLLYRSPLQRVIGDLGMGYYNSAYNYYTIILLISSYSIPAAISKVIAQKLAIKEYKNAHRIFRGACAYVLVVGAVASLFLYFAAGLFAASEEVIPVLRTFAPTIFIYGILGVLRGYFQAHRSMTQTSVSQIFEQIANALVSVGAACLLIKHAMGTMEMPVEEAQIVERAKQGAIGSAIGTGAGVLIALLFMTGVYFLNKNFFDGRIRRDKHKNVDSYASIFKMITLVVTPFILSTAINNLSSVVNNTIYTKILPSMKGLDSVEIYSRWGIFSGQSLTISNIPIAFASAMAAAMIPAVSALVAAKNIEEAKDKIHTAIKTTMLISIPSAVGLLVLARPIIDLLFKNGEEALNLATNLLMALAISVIFYALSTLNSQILQGLGKLNAPIINAGIALVLQSVVAVSLLKFTNLDLYAIVIANIVYSGTICVLNQISVYRACGYRQEIVRTFCIPALAAGVMGAFAWAVYEGLLLLTRSPKISVLLAIAPAAAVYFVLLILFRGVTKEELNSIPKGHVLVKIAVKCRLMK